MLSRDLHATYTSSSLTLQLKKVRSLGKGAAIIGARTNMNTHRDYLSMRQREQRQTASEEETLSDSDLYWWENNRYSTRGAAVL